MTTTARLTREELVATIHNGFAHQCGESADPYCQREAAGFADFLLANPDVVLRQFGVVDAMEAHGWSDHEIGAAMDGRYRGMELTHEQQKADRHE